VGVVANLWGGGSGFEWLAFSSSSALTGQVMTLSQSGLLTTYNHIVPNSSSTYGCGTTSQYWASVSAVGYNTMSSAKLKEGIAPLEYGTAFVKELQPMTYKRKDVKDERIHYGFLAEQIGSTAMGHKDKSAMVALDDDGQAAAIQYHQLIAPMVSCLQDIFKRLDALEKNLSQG